jgi:hypothetical protein
MCYGGCNCERCNGPKTEQVERKETDCLHPVLEFIEADNGIGIYECGDCDQSVFITKEDFGVRYHNRDVN